MHNPVGGGVDIKCISALGSTGLTATASTAAPTGRQEARQRDDEQGTSEPSQPLTGTPLRRQRDDAQGGQRQPECQERSRGPEWTCRPQRCHSRSRMHTQDDGGRSASGRNGDRIKGAETQVREPRSGTRVCDIAGKCSLTIGANWNGTGRNAASRDGRAGYNGCGDVKVCAHYQRDRNIMRGDAVRAMNVEIEGPDSWAGCSNGKVYAAWVRPQRDRRGERANHRRTRWAAQGHGATGITIDGSKCPADGSALQNRNRLRLDDG